MNAPFDPASNRSLASGRDQDTNTLTETATFGGGCFWCTEAVLEQLDGVQAVQSGYMGGHVDNPTYKQICTGTTNHAEVVQVRFDP
ncbi:MAG: peptide-methionine (S)-S-oxide reductase, partial [Planctomycetota bacterium]